ncbi:hypothetical protein HU200_010630 [Digitaria exilis]|uniref:non-specific serine/threonine protein kinase n=1 Tax=Digitaria exilis TaxID=1010633 RepID=A0A835FIM2_9POAL|nr:hypothetical protein HU200_010630 [Digitaria exilis]
MNQAISNDMGSGGTLNDLPTSNYGSNTEHKSLPRLSDGIPAQLLQCQASERLRQTHAVAFSVRGRRATTLDMCVCSTWRSVPPRWERVRPSGFAFDAPLRRRSPVSIAAHWNALVARVTEEGIESLVSSSLILGQHEHRLPDSLLAVKVDWFVGCVGLDMMREERGDQSESKKPKEFEDQQQQQPARPTKAGLHDGPSCGLLPPGTYPFCLLATEKSSVRAAEYLLSPPPKSPTIEDALRSKAARCVLGGEGSTRAMPHSTQLCNPVSKSQMWLKHACNCKLQPGCAVSTVSARRIDRSSLSTNLSHTAIATHIDASRRSNFTARSIWSRDACMPSASNNGDGRHRCDDASSRSKRCSRQLLTTRRDASFITAHHQQQIRICLDDGEIAVAPASSKARQTHVGASHLACTALHITPPFDLGWHDRRRRCTAWRFRWTGRVSTLRQRMDERYTCRSRAGNNGTAASVSGGGGGGIHAGSSAGRHGGRRRTRWPPRPRMMDEVRPTRKTPREKRPPRTQTHHSSCPPTQHCHASHSSSITPSLAAAMTAVSRAGGSLRGAQLDMRATPERYTLTRRSVQQRPDAIPATYRSGGAFPGGWRHPGMAGWAMPQDDTAVAAALAGPPCPYARVSRPSNPPRKRPREKTHAHRTEQSTPPPTARQLNTVTLHTHTLPPLLRPAWRRRPSTSPDLPTVATKAHPAATLSLSLQSPTSPSPSHSPPNLYSRSAVSLACFSGRAGLPCPAPAADDLLPPIPMPAPAMARATLSLALPHLLLFLLLRCGPEPAAALRFDYATLTLGSLKLLGDAHLKNGTIRLSRDMPVPTSGSGRALYASPVPLRAGFSTQFAFTVTTLNPSSVGGGLAFVVAADDSSLGDAGAYIGVSTATDAAAVEFDTLMDVQFGDLNGNHVGLDLGSMVSAAAADLDQAGVELTSGRAINAWIDYLPNDKRGEILEVFVSYTAKRPRAPVLSAPLELGDTVKEAAFVGFSASTQGSTEVHAIEWWGFSTPSPSPPPRSAPAPPPESPAVQPPPPTSVVNPVLPSPLLPGTTTPSATASAPTSSISAASGPSSSAAAVARNAGSPPRPAAHAAVAGAATACAFVAASFAGFALWALARRARARKRTAASSAVATTTRRRDSSSLASAAALARSPREFSYKELSAATRGFDSTRVIGNGAFGTVYKGIIPDTGAMVAVKRCTKANATADAEQARSEFLSELSIIAGLRHRNLLRLQGWCYEKGEILLVYDYMRNGSLDKALFDDASTSPPILAGVASALAYLHHECERRVIHRDVKSSNVMLDEAFRARLGDFGLARQAEHGESPDATAAAGTMGYLAPEYLLTGRATEATDVFSFGALVLEVTCGRRPIGTTEGTRCNNLVEWVWSLHGEGRVLDAVDARLGGEFDEGEMRRAMLVGLACSSPEPAMRPGMRAVVQMLSGEADPPFVPAARPSMSFSANHQLLLSLQDSVSDYNALGLTLSDSSEDDSMSSSSLTSTLRRGGHDIGFSSTAGDATLERSSSSFVQQDLGRRMARKASGHGNLPALHYAFRRRAYMAWKPSMMHVTNRKSPPLVH